MKTINLWVAVQFAWVYAIAGEVKTEFEGSAVLDDSQIRIVKELALRAGLPSVARIYTYNIHPSPCFGINVVSREEIRGREGTSSCLAIGYEKWEPGGSKHEKVKFRSGDFWVRPWIIQSRFGIFSGARGEVKISLSDKISFATADKIFALFTAGKIHFRTADLKAKFDEWRTADATLTSISWDAPNRGWLGIAVRHAHAGMSLDCIFEEGEIVVVDVNQVIS